MYMILKNCLRGWLGVPEESFLKKLKIKASWISVYTPEVSYCPSLYLRSFEHFQILCHFNPVTSVQRGGRSQAILKDGKKVML